jgi:small GTP-binding protein
MPDRKYILKLCLLGDGAVGKTSLVRRFVFDAFDDKYIMSFGTKVSKKVIDLGEVSVDLMIWDILGQKTQRALHGAYYRGAAGALLVCDGTRVETMQSLSSWVDGFISVAGEVPVTILVKKSDLERGYPFEDVVSFGESIGSTVYETSAKTGAHVEEAFREVTLRMLEAQR